MFGKVYIFAKLKSSAFRKYILLQTDFEMIFQQVELYNPRFAHFCHLQNHHNAGRLHILCLWKHYQNPLISDGIGSP